MFITTVDRLDNLVGAVTGLTAESRGIFFCGAATQRGLWPPYSWCFYITHNDAPQSLALLRTSDQPVAETSTWQHSTLTPDIHTLRRYSNPTISASERPLGPAITEEYWLVCLQCIPRRSGMFEVVLCVLSDLLSSGLKTMSISCIKFCRRFPDVKWSCPPKQTSRGTGSELSKNKPWERERNVFRDVIWNKVIYFEWNIFREIMYNILGGVRHVWFCFVVEGWDRRYLGVGLSFED